MSTGSIGVYEDQDQVVDLVALRAELEDQFPHPVGHSILVAPCRQSEITQGGIVQTEERLDLELEASIVGKVVELGPDAYQNKRIFSGAPWCEEGDYILMKSYSGYKCMVNGIAFRFINDDTVQGTVKNPGGIGRA